MTHAGPAAGLHAWVGGLGALGSAVAVAGAVGALSPAVSAWAGVGALAALFAWQRARAQEADVLASTEARRGASLRVLEAEATLELLTGGWFTRWRRARSSVEAQLSAPPAR